MKFVRLLAVAFIAAVVFLAVPGADRALATSNTTLSSPADAGYDYYPTIAGTVTQSGNQSAVTRIDVTVESLEGASADNVTKSFTNTGSFSFTFQPARNGRFRVTAKGTGQYNSIGCSNGRCTETSTDSRDFSVGVKPAAPTGVSAGPSPTTGDVTVTWTPNKEADIVGYSVGRSYAGGGTKWFNDPVAPSSKPTFHDDLKGAPQGQYRYQVIAVRKACNSCVDDPIPSSPSAFSAPVTVQATVTTTSTTTTTIKKNPGGGGGTTNTTVKGGGGGTTGTTVKGGGTTGTTVKGGSSGGKAAPSNTGGFAPGGTVDLSQFKGLLSGGTSASGSGGRAPEDEGTYDPTLGYDPSEKPVQNNDDDNLITIGGASIPAPSDDWVKFIGAGSLMTALLVHVLWFKQQVDRVPLETIEY